MNPLHRAEEVLLRGLGGVLLGFIVLPLIALFLAGGLGGLLTGMSSPLVWPALRLSLLSASASVLLLGLLGTPLAWLLARSRGRSERVLQSLVALPSVMPPAVAGLALLLAFGRHGVLASLLGVCPSVAFTGAAVVLAAAFVSAPLYLQAAVSAFRAIDPGLILVARALGASPLRLFLRIAVPLALPGLLAGAITSWARALGEFGATLMFAGNLTGRTQTLPLAVYTAMESDLDAARALATVLVSVAGGVLLVAQHLPLHGRAASVTP